MWNPSISIKLWLILTVPSLVSFRLSIQVISIFNLMMIDNSFCEFIYLTCFQMYFQIFVVQHFTSIPTVTPPENQITNKFQILWWKLKDSKHKNTKHEAEGSHAMTHMIFNQEVSQARIDTVLVSSNLMPRISIDPFRN